MFSGRVGQDADGPAKSDLPEDPRRALTSIGAVVYDWDLRSDTITWGANADEASGLPGLALADGRDFCGLVVPMAGLTRTDAILSSVERDFGSGVSYAATYGLRLGPGSVVIADDTGRWYADASGRPARAHGLMRLRRADPAETDLNRARVAFLNGAATDLAQAATSNVSMTLFAMAIGNLSEINDEIGFEEADAVIETMLARLSGATRHRDRFARYSGNRFALMLRGCTKEQSAIAAERVLRLACSERVGSSRGPLEVKLVIGAASAPDHAQDANGLLRKAEASLGIAKRRAGPPFIMHDPRVFRRALRRDAVLDSVEVLNARRIAIACQPVVHADTRETAFEEALLRVETEDGRVEVAGDIIPALERAGLIHLADGRMLELAADHLLANPDKRVALNVSAKTLDRPDWLGVLAGHLGARPGVASRLILELTETAIVHDPDAMRRVLEGAKALGVMIAIDDFGAGHTSFRTLRTFPVDLLKIDGAFCQNLSPSVDDRFFVRTLVDLAQHLGIATVAEWVEDEETAQLLTSWGVDYLQGDHCGRPSLVGARPGVAPMADLLRVA